MTRQELRIGNYFQWSPFASMGNGVDRITHGQQIEDYLSLKEGIAITEEWLEKFGFQSNRLFSSLRRPMDNPMNGLNKTWLIISYDWQIGWLEVFERDGHPESVQTFKFPVQHVHQLQNLYYALTGKELEILATSKSL